MIRCQGGRCILHDVVGGSATPNGRVVQITGNLSSQA